MQNYNFFQYLQTKSRKKRKIRNGRHCAWQYCCVSSARSVGKTARSPTTIIRSLGFSVSCKGGFAIDGLTTTIGSAATAIGGAAIIHAIDIGLLQARCDAHLARHQVARGQTVHADGAHILSHLPVGGRLRTTAVDGSAEDTKVVNLLIAIVSKISYLLTHCFFKSS